MILVYLHAWDSDEDNTGRVLLRRDFSGNLRDIDYEALYADVSDQKLMELFFEQFRYSTKSRFQEMDGSYRDVCEWHENIQCDENDRVVSIVYKFSAEELALDLLPRCLEVFVIPCDKSGRFSIFSPVALVFQSGNFCSGPLHVSRLPPTLRIFDVFGNLLKSEVDLTQMPRNTIDFIISRNRFFGSCNLTNLPPRLARCELYNNFFSGTISLDDLPKTLKSLYLSVNSFEGALNFARLPDSLRTLHLNYNNFSGPFILDQRNAPIFLDARDNEFSGDAVVPSCDDVRVFLKTLASSDGITNVLDENGDVHERKVSILSIDNPSFVMGEVDENADLFLYRGIKQNAGTNHS